MVHMNKYLFLDIDGVLNSGDYFDKRNKIPHGGELSMDIDPVAVNRLRHVLNKTGASVVLSSSWRLSPTWKDDLIYHGFPFEDITIVGITPDMGASLGGRFSRGLEIEKWLEDNVDFSILTEYSFSDMKQHCQRIGLHSYAIVDDDADMTFTQRYNFVQTSFEVGLTSKTADKLIEVLNTPIWEQPYFDDYETLNGV